MQKLRQLSFGQERKAEELEDIFRLYQFETYVSRNDFLAGAKHHIPDREYNPVITIMLLPQRGMMGAMQMRRDDEIGDELFTRKGEIAMVEQHEEHSHHLADHDDACRHAKEDDAEAFDQNL